jgi:ParB family chromosome partitioning protein
MNGELVPIAELLPRIRGLDYEREKQDIIAYTSLTECKAVSDVYAGIITSLQRHNLESGAERAKAHRLYCRAIRRSGELLNQFPSGRGLSRQQQAQIAKSHVDVLFATRSEIATKAGFSKRQRDTAERLAAIPIEIFDELVERKAPPTIEKLRRFAHGKTDGRTVIDPLIKPSDNWNFSNTVYQRIDGEPGKHGYIPGDVYANVLWYWTRPNDVVVAPMAGSGQILAVYDNRIRWMQPEPWELSLHCFDLSPRGPYRDRIKQHDLTLGFPVGHTDYIIIDLPYYAMAKGQYSDKATDLANLTGASWQRALAAVAKACSSAQSAENLCTIITPNFRDISSKAVFLVTREVQQRFEHAGYQLYDVAYASRRIQRQQSFDMAHHNNAAKRQRIMLTDIAEIMTFRRIKRRRLERPQR